MVGYDVTSRVAALLLQPKQTPAATRPIPPTAAVRALLTASAGKPTPATSSISLQGKATLPCKPSNLCGPQSGYVPQQRIYELDFDCLKQEILALKANAAAEVNAVTSHTALLEDSKRRKGPTQEALQEAQLKLRQIQNKGCVKVSRSVSSYAENRHSSLLQIFQKKSDATTELRFKLENLRLHKGDLAQKQDDILYDIRLLRQQTPCRKEIILKHRMDLIAIKDEQAQKLLFEVNKARASMVERETGGKAELDKLILEYSSIMKNLASFKCTMKNIKREKSDEECRWQNVLSDSRQKLSLHNNRRSQRNQEYSEVVTEIRNQLEKIFSKKLTIEEVLIGLSRKQHLQCQRKKDIIASDRQLVDAKHQILCDHQTIEPVVKKIAMKLKLRTSKLEARLAQSEVQFSVVIAEDENQLLDLRHKIDVQKEAMTKLENVSAVTDDRITKVRKEEMNISRKIISTTRKIAEVKQQVSSLRQKVHELNKWKRKLEAVGVTPECYLRRLQERIEFVNTELLGVHKNQILCQDPAGLRPIPRHCSARRQSDRLPGYLKDSIPTTTDPIFLETLKEAFIGQDRATGLSSPQSPEEYGDICKKYLNYRMRSPPDSRRNGQQSPRR